MACGTVNSQVNYLKKLALYREEKPFQLFIPIDPGASDQRASNLEFESKECTFSDIRDIVQECSLDAHGFQVQKSPTKLDLSSFQDRSVVESQYFSEIEQILKDIEGGYDRVFIFDWRLRDAATPRSGNEFDMNDLTTWLRPSPTAHIRAIARCYIEFNYIYRTMHSIYYKEELESSSQFRSFNFTTLGFVDQQSSIWRPLEHAVQDYPLAFCDPASVSDEDLVECDHIRRKFKGANLYAYYNDTHDWRYLGDHQPDEVLLLKMFDSDASVAARSEYMPPNPKPMCRKTETKHHQGFYMHLSGILLPLKNQKLAKASRFAPWSSTTPKQNKPATVSEEQ